MLWLKKTHLLKKIFIYPLELLNDFRSLKTSQNLSDSNLISLRIIWELALRKVIRNLLAVDNIESIET